MVDLKKVPNGSQEKEPYKETSAVQMVTIFFSLSSQLDHISY